MSIFSRLFRKKQKQWQLRQEDGSWLNVSNKDKPGIYRFITMDKGVPTFSPLEEVKDE